MRYRTRCVHEFKDGPEVEPPYPPEDGCDHLEQKVGDRWVLGYLAHDDSNNDIDDLMGECMGNLYSLHRWAPKGDHEKVYEALGLDPYGNKPDPEDYEDGEMPQPNPDAVVLDCYDHSGQHWSITGGGMQCQWDTARGAGVWLPDKCLLDELKGLEGAERRAKCVEYCQQFLDQYNACLMGDVWGVIVAWYDDEGKLIDEDSCWGFIGGEWAEESLAETFKWRCEAIQKEYDEERRTSCGLQEELPL